MFLAIAFWICVGLGIFHVGRLFQASRIGKDIRRGWVRDYERYDPVYHLDRDMVFQLIAPMIIISVMGIILHICFRTPEWNETAPPPPYYLAAPTAGGDTK